MSKFQIFIPIAKVNRDQRTVGGWATTEKVDKQNEVVDYEASKEAFDNWHGNIREMHEPKAVGKAIDIKQDDDTKRIYVTAKISKGAQDTWEKVKDGTLTGFSIGGQTVDSKTVIVKDGDDHRQVKRITKYRLTELSLVDNPANPEAQFELVKNVSGQLRQTSVVEDSVAKKMTQKYNGGEYKTMALSKDTLNKISKLVKTLDSIVKEDWEDPNAEVGSAKETPHQTTEGTEVAKQEGKYEDANPEVGASKTTPKQTTEGKTVKADMTTESDLQTQEEDGSDAAPVTKLYKRNKDGTYEEMTTEDAKKFLKADMTTESDLQTQDEDGSDAAPVTKRRKMDEDEDHMDKADDDDEDMDKAADDEDEDVEKAEDEDEDVDKAYDDDEDDTKKRRTRKRHRKAYDEDEDMDKADDEEDEESVSKTVLSELRKISKRIDKMENTPLPRKYRKIEKDANGNEEGSEDALIQKTTDEVRSAQEASRISGQPISQEIERKKDWLIAKSFDKKFGTGQIRKV